MCAVEHLIKFRVVLQLGIDEVGDFTDSVVKLPTLVTLKLA